MTRRERLLAIGVGAIVGLFALQYTFNSFRTALRQKQENALAAEVAFDEATMIETAGFNAAQKLEKLKPKSLSANAVLLERQYSDWLVQLGQQAGLSSIEVKIQRVTAARFGTTKDRPAYVPHAFTLDGNCRTDQLIQLLAGYYDRDYLHSITNLKLTPSKDDPNRFALSLTSRALTLDGAASDQQPSLASSGRLTRSVEEYKTAILNRNPFAPPNKPPALATARSQEIKKGEDWKLALEATDPENHPVDFELVSTEVPEGLSFSGNELSFKSDELGEYVVTVRAKDRGWPSRSTEEKLMLRVVEPPKVEEPKVETKFDVATQAFVTSMVSGRRGPQASIRSRTEGKTVELIEGGEIEVGEIKAKVIGINLNEEFIELETDGERWLLDWGTSVAEAYKKSQID